MKNITKIYEKLKHKEDYYVVYNHRGKSKEEIERKILEYNRATIELDTILKYNDYYTRRFYPKTRLLTRDYVEVGRDVIEDHAMEWYIALTWRDARDTLVSIKYSSRLTDTYYYMYYSLSESSVDSILTPILKGNPRKW